MGREGHGIPTGPLASRLLAEVLLNEVDEYLLSKGVDFVRWVDDYNLFTRSLGSAKATVLDLAAWLYRMGLTLQSAKTHILDDTAYAESFLVDLDDKLSDAGAIIAELLRTDYDDTDDFEEYMDDLLAVQLLETLVDAISDDEHVDYRIVGFVVRRLRNMSLDRRVANELLEVLVENIDLLVPVIAAVAPLIVKLVPKSKMSKRIGNRLLRSMHRAGLDHHALWILTIFAERGRKAFVDRLFDVYQRTESQVVRRFAVLAISGSGGRVEYKHQEWDRASPLLQLALLKVGNLRSKELLKPRGKLEELLAGAVPT